MNTLRAPFASLCALLLGLAVIAPTPAQNGPYDSESFESHRYTLGNLAGTDLWNGQDGWILFDSLAYPGNLAAARVQDQVVRHGQQAIVFDAAAMTPGSFGELRRNAMFNLGSGVIEAEWNFRITSSSSPSARWEFYTQPAPMPQSCQQRWGIAADGRVEFYDTPARVVVQTNTYVTKDVWHHARSVVDVIGNRTEIHIDGVLVATGTPIAVFGALPVHGFSQFDCVNAGNDALYIDDFGVRERTAAHGLRAHPPRLPIGRRTIVDLQLAGGPQFANRPYAVFASLSGTAPGTPIGSVTMPLVQDGFMGIVIGSLAVLPGFLAQANAAGNAEAVFDTQIPVPAGLLGLQLHFAYVALGPIDRVSEPVRLTVTNQ
ncbi:MAG: hypothetical protein MUC36_21300 [Planctomycetes bacterium]|jgi:hypothetical protein|nr:hypothetical protein [Planctomycetota bacterium]